MAAGASTRLGEPKQLVRIGGERLLERAVRIAGEAGCDPVLVVLGAHSETVMASCDLTRVRVVVNEIWEEGVASSIRSGLAGIDDDVDAALLMTCDQPAVTAQHLRRLMETGPLETVASIYAGKRGVPAYFPAVRFAELSKLQGDSGAAGLLAAARAIDLPGGEIDVDTQASLIQARGLFGEPHQ